MKEGFKLLLRNWLIHSVVVYIVIILFTGIPILLNPVRYGYTSHPGSVTIHDYFHSLFGSYFPLQLLFTFLLIEINYQYLFKKINLAWYFGTCLIVAILLFILIAGTNFGFYWAATITATPVMFIATIYALLYSFIRDNFQSKERAKITFQSFKKSLKPLLRGWLMHFAIVWGVIMLFTDWIYFYNSSIYGYYQYNANNKPVTAWQYFLNHIFHGADAALALFILLLMEINYQYVFKKIQLAVYVFTCLLVGLVSLCTLVYGYRVSNWAEIAHRVPALPYVALYTLIYSFIRDYWHTASRRKDIQLQQSKNELDALKAQLNPHFLFNSLNYLYGTALNEKAPDTADGIDKLSDMMRYTISGVHENFVPLENELKFTENYLALQQARLPKSDNIAVTIQIEHPAKPLQIAPLMLLPFIENAFKYGISIDEPCYVTIRISLSGDTLIMEISNSIIEGLMEIKGNSIGIKNTKKRLDLLYGDNYDLKQTNNGTEYKTLLTLKLNS